MRSDYQNKTKEPEKLPFATAVFYNFVLARLLAPSYQFIAEDLPLKNEGALVDIGCGPGDLAYLIARKYPDIKVIGIDLSEPVIALAKRKKLANLTFQVMDGQNMAFGDNYIEHIVSSISFHHWHDKLKGLNEMYRVLKQGGYAWIYDFCSDVSDNDINLSLKSFFGIRLPKKIIRKNLQLHGFSMEEYNGHIKDLIAQSPFKEVSFKQLKAYMRIEIRK